MSECSLFLLWLSFTLHRPLTWAPARMSKLTISLKPPWAAKNNDPAPVWMKRAGENFLLQDTLLRVLLAALSPTFRRRVGSAPCLMSSRQHSRWPAAAAIISGVVPSFYTRHREKNEKSEQQKIPQSRSSGEQQTTGWQTRDEEKKRTNNNRRKSVWVAVIRSNDSHSNGKKARPADLTTMISNV